MCNPSAVGSVKDGGNGESPSFHVDHEGTFLPSTQSAKSVRGYPRFSWRSDTPLP
jgi:hypothetical protein